jgi:hypothetical protein
VRKAKQKPESLKTLYKTSQRNRQRKNSSPKQQRPLFLLKSQKSKHPPTNQKKSAIHKKPKLYISWPKERKQHSTQKGKRKEVQ